MSLLPVNEALQRILAGVRPLSSELVSILEAHGRVLAKPITSKRDQPPFPASAMDGYALRHSDLSKHSEFVVVGTAAAGHAYKGRIGPGQAVRILTGAPLPKELDTIVIQENTQRDGNKLKIVEASSKGKNVRPQGLDFKQGDVLIPAGSKLNARDIGLAAAGNASIVRVVRRPQITLFTTGDELVLPGQRPRPDQIVTSNSYALESMCKHWGAEVVNLGIVADSIKATESAIRRGTKSDVLITTGGASVGDHDFVQQALKNSGAKIGFWKIALRPGKPLMFGTKGKTRILGLPGNPVSALVCARIFIKPLIDKLLGLSVSDETVSARLASDLPQNDNRQDYIRAKLSRGNEGVPVATPYPLQDSSMQRTLRDADCLIIREPHAAPARAGSTVAILLLDF